MQLSDPFFQRLLALLTSYQIIDDHFVWYDTEWLLNMLWTFFFDEIFTQDNTQDIDTLDVYSLFSNIPLAETNNTFTKKLFQNPESLGKGISENESRDLLNLVFKELFFSFKNKFCTQANDVAVKSPLVSMLDNIFISYHEENWLTEHPIKCKTSFYEKYVDGIFDFLNHMNMSTHFENMSFLTNRT